MDEYITMFFFGLFELCWVWGKCGIFLLICHLLLSFWVCPLDSPGCRHEAHDPIPLRVVRVWPCACRLSSRWAFTACSLIGQVHGSYGQPIRDDVSLAPTDCPSRPFFFFFLFLFPSNYHFICIYTFFFFLQYWILMAISSPPCSFLKANINMSGDSGSKLFYQIIRFVKFVEKKVDLAYIKRIKRSSLITSF